MNEKFIILRTSDLPDGYRGGNPAAPEFLTADARLPPSARLRPQIEEMGQRDADGLRRERGVLAVAPAMPMQLVAPLKAAGTADAGDGIAWGVKAVRADTSPYRGSGIVVAVLDTGIDPSHAAFAGMELERQNFTEEADDDRDGHGTHCAGTIFGREVGGIRIGVAPGVKRALIAKVLGQGGGSSDQLVAAIHWACDHGAHVISMSLGMDFPGYVRVLTEHRGVPSDIAVSRALEGYRANVLLFERLASFMRAREHPTLIVAAAGNESRRVDNRRYTIAVSPPAVAEGIVSVGALGPGPTGLSVADFSNTGAVVSAPGVDVLSARVGGGLATMSGTSMAAPHVAGVAALWAERILINTSALTTSRLMNGLLRSARDDALAPDWDAADVGEGLIYAPQ